MMLSEMTALCPPCMQKEDFLHRRTRVAAISSASLYSQIRHNWHVQAPWLLAGCLRGATSATPKRLLMQVACMTIVIVAIPQMALRHILASPSPVEHSEIYSDMAFASSHSFSSATLGWREVLCWALECKHPLCCEAGDWSHLR